MDGKNCGCSCEQCKGGSCHGNSCGGCLHAGGHNWLIRLILGLVILFMVFKIGMAVGSFSAGFGGDGVYRSNRMMDGNPMMNGYYGGAAAYDATDIGNISF
ncbi:MAG TPA: hypothetical protein VI953_00490 [Candidatus Paceibacterota bacterium]